LATEPWGQAANAVTIRIAGSFDRLRSSILPMYQAPYAWLPLHQETAWGRLGRLACPQSFLYNVVTYLELFLERLKSGDYCVSSGEVNLDVHAADHSFASNKIARTPMRACTPAGRTEQG
jgi:hypothetical protein